jgi:sec-independent protein translocase protein TatA
MFNVGPMELMVILVLALIVFGPKKLPEMGKSIGKGLKEFRKAQMDIRREISQGLNESPTGEGTSGQPADSPAGTATSDGHGTTDQTSA